jgi:hypothetical protein
MGSDLIVLTNRVGLGADKFSGADKLWLLT